jgi:hypothetical protein
MSSTAPLGTKKHFATASSLRRFTPAVLARFLHFFPDYLAAIRLKVPAPEAATGRTMPYDAIVDACMAPRIDTKLDGVLFMATHLGDQDGWERIQEEMAIRGLNATFDANDFTHYDLPLLVWLQGQPDHPDILEQSYARGRIHAKSSYTYYAPTADRRAAYKKPNKTALTELRGTLAEHFTGDPRHRDVTLLDYDYDEEIWFLVRYPGQPVRPDAIGAKTPYAELSYIPGQYDAIVYHKKFGDLRINSVRKKEHGTYRTAFGHALLNEGNAFDPTRKLITLAPLRGACRHLFAEDDAGDFPRVRPIEACFFDISFPGKRITWRADGKEEHLLKYAMTEDPRLLLPSTTDTIVYAKFRYRLKDSDAWHSMTVHHGMILRFERDGHSAVLEQWLRKRKFIHDVLAHRRERT